MNGCFATLTLYFIILFYGVLGCISKSMNKADDSDFSETTNSQEQIVSDLKENQTKMSTLIDESSAESINLSMSPRLEVQFTFDLERTAENPLRGFYTNYAWSEPVIDFPDSLEFAYIPLSDLMLGPSDFTFDTSLEPRLLAAEARAHQLVLRPYIDYPALVSGLTDFLDGQVEMRSYTQHGGGLSPDYDDPDLRAALLSFIEALGQKYDGDPRLAVVQIGLLGFWGEWHTWPHDAWFPDADFQSEVLNAYATAFEKTFLQVRKPVADVTNLRIGFHDDSFAYSTLGDIDWYFHSLLIEAKADDRWREIPIGGELRPELQGEVFEDGYITGVYRQDFSDCVEATHASMLLAAQLYSGGLNSTIERERAEAAALSLGYALHVSRAAIFGDSLEVSLENRGVAPFYPAIFLQVEDSNGMKATVELPRLTSDQGCKRFRLSISMLISPSREAPWTLSLRSDYILPTQKILFATAPGKDAIRVE